MLVSLIGKRHLKLVALLAIVLLALFSLFALFDQSPQNISLTPAISLSLFLLASVVMLLSYLYQRKYHKERAIFKAVVDFSLEFTYIRTVKGRYQYVSPAVYQLTGYSTEDFYQTPNFMDAIIHPEDRPYWNSHVHHVNEDGSPEKVEFRILTKEGETRWLEHLCGPVHDEQGKITGVRSINIDITERKASEEKVKQLSLYDPLTELPNRRYLNQYMSDLIGKLEQRKSLGGFSVFFVDLDRFKYVNDAYGHSVGDQLLKEVAYRFKSSCVQTENTMISRFGGDEFVIVAKNKSKADDIQRCVNRMKELLEKPFRIDGHRLNIGFSAGVALYPQDGVTPEQLIKHADAAMYKAKSQGLNLAFYSEDMEHHASEMLDIHGRLQNAIKSQKIKPHYQPLVDMTSGETIGVEVLARWLPENGEFAPSPAEFIPVSEETGLIWSLSDSIISQAAMDILAWQKQGYKMKYSINVSARQFTDDNFCSHAMEQLESLGIKPSSVQIELTESVLLNNVDRSIEKIKELKSRGFLIALDDFGTGFASLHYLTLFPLDTLKVDRAFVRDIVNDKRQFAIAKSIINLAKDLSLSVVAEGIETEEQRQLLLKLGCDTGQGYLFSKPVPPEELFALAA